MDHGSTNGTHDVHDEFGFDDLEIYSSRAQTKRVKAFADQRRKVKPSRKHVRTSNPIKVLQERKDINEDDQNASDDDVGESALKKSTEQDKGSDVNGIHENNDQKINHKQQIIGRTSLYSKVGKTKGREHVLNSDAKKGLKARKISIVQVGH